MKIAICQINPIVGDFDYNHNILLKYYKKCICLNANIIVFPELIICGYPHQDLLWEDGFVDQNLLNLNKIASVSSIPLIFGFIRKENGQLFNSAAVCFDGKLQSSFHNIK